MKITSQHIIILFFLSGVLGDEVKKVSVMEGDSVTLDPNITENRILWRFGSELIAEISDGKISYKPGPDGRFRDRLRLDTETGSLTITNMKMKHSSPYKLDAIGSTSGTTYKRINVSVYESPSAIPVEAEMKSVPVTAGKSLTLQTGVLHPRDELIVWRFGEEGKLIAKADLEANNSLHEDIDERFSDRLKLNNQDGSLTINNMRNTDSGLYIVKISSSKQTLHKKFSVTVIDTSLSTGVVTGIAVAGFIVVLIIILLLFYIYYCGEEVWRLSNLKRQISPISKKLSKMSTKLTHLDKTSKQLLETSKKLDNLSKISEKYLSKESKTEISGICDQLNKLLTISTELKNTSMSCDQDLREISEELNKLFEGKISEKLSEISTKLSNISGELIHLLSVKEGETARLKTGDENLQNVKIKWKFGDENSSIAEIKEGADLIIHDNVLRGKFKGRLELDKETGSLSINNTNTGDSGEYTVRIKSSTKQNKFLMFVVSVSKNGASESAAVEIPLLSKEQQSSV